MQQNGEGLVFDHDNPEDVNILRAIYYGLRIQSNNTDTRDRELLRQLTGELSQEETHGTVMLRGYRIRELHETIGRVNRDQVPVYGPNITAALYALSSAQTSNDIVSR